MALAVAGSIVALASFAPAAVAVSFSVTKTADTRDGLCSAADCSLREAIDAANAVVSDDEINLPPGTYELTRANPGNVTEDANDTGDLDLAALSGVLTIRGFGPGLTTVDANSIDRILHFEDNRPVVELRDLTLTGGDPSANTDVTDDDGGAIRMARANLTLRNVVFDGNRAQRGGAIAILVAADTNEGLINARETVFSDNRAIEPVSGTGGALLSTGESHFVGVETDFTGNRSAYVGGAVELNDRSAMSLVDSTAAGNVSDAPFAGGGFLRANHQSRFSMREGEISENRTPSASGGGIYANNRSTLSLSRVAVESNQAGNEGGGIYMNNESHGLITDSSISGNQSEDGGGLVAHNESLTTIVRSTIAQNTATSTGGGFLVRNQPSLVISESTISGNAAEGADPDRGGGGLQIGAGSQGSRVSVIRSTLTGNRAPAGDGGGIAMSADGPNRLEVENSTLSGNAAGRTGGALFVSGAANRAELAATTLVSNTASGDGGAIRNSGNPDAVRVYLSVVASNVGSPAQCSGPIVSQSENLDSGTSCSFIQIGDIQNGIADLEPLGDNGGPTLTHALGPSSQARDESVCDLPVDQRGEARPKGSLCDIGAFEAEPIPPDTTGPELSFKVVGKKNLKKLAVVVTSNEDARLIVSGKARPPRVGGRKAGKNASSAAKKLKARFKKKRPRLTAGVKRKIGLRFSKKNRRKVARALRKPRIKKVKAFVKLVARDEAENVTKRSTKFKIAKKRRKNR